MDNYIPDIDYWIGRVILIISAIIFVIKEIQDTRFYMNYEIPNQAADLVRQAHLGQPFQVMWDIEVNGEMKDALRAPLTKDQLCLISQLKDDIVSYSAYVHLLSHKLNSDELTAVVSVALNIVSRSGAFNYECSDSKLRITISRCKENELSKKWAVTSVEQL